MATTAKQRAIFATETHKRKLGSGFRRMPAAMVSGSPMKGSQDNSKVHLPYCWLPAFSTSHLLALYRELGLVLSLNLV